MITSGRSSSRRRLPVEWIVTLVAALLTLAWWLTSRPFVLAPLPEAEQVARVDEPDGAASVLIVLPQSPETELLSEMHFDRTWLNTVEQEVGAARVVSAARLSRWARTQHPSFYPPAPAVHPGTADTAVLAGPLPPASPDGPRYQLLHCSSGNLSSFVPDVARNISRCLLVLCNSRCLLALKCR